MLLQRVTACVTLVFSAFSSLVELEKRYVALPRLLADKPTCASNTLCFFLCCCLFSTQPTFCQRVWTLVADNVFNTFVVVADGFGERDKTDLHALIKFLPATCLIALAAGKTIAALLPAATCSHRFFICPSWLLYNIPTFLLPTKQHTFSSMRLCCRWLPRPALAWFGMTLMRYYSLL